MGHGKINAGGNALNFFSYLTIQSSRVAWLAKTVGGKKVRKGARVKWATYKNHAMKCLQDEQGNPILLPESVNLDITAEGINLAVTKKEDIEEASE